MSVVAPSGTSSNRHWWGYIDSVTSRLEILVDAFNLFKKIRKRPVAILAMHTGHGVATEANLREYMYITYASAKCE